MLDDIGHFGSAAALVDLGDGRRWSFDDLGDRVARFAGMMADLGARRVAAVGPNNVAWIDAYYGVGRAGGVLCFINHRLSIAQIAESIASMNVDLVLAAPGISIPDGVRVVRMGTDYESRLSASSPAPPAATGPEQVVWELPTSGTTGRAKIVRLSHASIEAAAATTIAARPMHGDEVYLFPFPLCHVAGYNVVMFHHSGRPVVLVPGFEPAAVVGAIVEHRVTHLSLAPTMLVELLNYLDTAAIELPTLRCITYGASPITPPLLRRAVDTLGCEFAQGYGMTELSGNCVFLSPEDHRRGLGDSPHLLRAAGRPGRGVQIRLVDDAGDDVPTGDAGEVLVKAAQVMVGYADASDHAAGFVDGWLRTGDVGRFDDDGYLYLVDRRKDIIITGGENVASREVENLLAEHPDLSEVAVIGLPDDTWGETVCAVVVPKPGLAPSTAELLAWSRERIGGFKKPRRVEVVSALPRNATGKIDKPALRRQFSA